MKRLATKRKLFAFRRNHRLEIFDQKFQEELESMYRDTGAGRDPKPPALMAMVLQGYTGLSDADAVEATVLDLLPARARHAGAMTTRRSRRELSFAKSRSDVVGTAGDAKKRRDRGGRGGG